MRVPAGIDRGQRLRVAGKGHCGLKGGADGCLYLLVSILPQDVFTRNGLDVITRVSIDPVTAVLGGKARVATPYELIDIDIPAGTCSGKRLTLAGRGLKSNAKTGSLTVELSIDPYVKLTAAQKKQLEEFKKTLSDSNFPKKGEYERAAKKVI